MTALFTPYFRIFTSNFYDNASDVCVCMCVHCIHIQVTIRFDQIQLVRIAAVGCRHRWRRCTRWWRWWSSYRCRRRPISVLHRVRLVDLLCLGLDLHGCRLRRLLNLGVGLVQVCGTVGAGSRAGRLLLLCGCCGRRKHRVQDMIESVYLRWIGRDSDTKNGYCLKIRALLMMIMWYKLRALRGNTSIYRCEVGRFILINKNSKSFTSNKKR